MPLTDYQAQLARLLSPNRTLDKHLAGGAALHFSPNSLRFSNDLDYFNDSDQLVAEAYENDQRTLIDAGYSLKLEIRQPGYIRVLVRKKKKVQKLSGHMILHGDFFQRLRTPTAVLDFTISI